MPIISTNEEKSYGRPANGLDAVYDLLPRLIELSPKLQARSDWPTRRAKLTVIA